MSADRINGRLGRGPREHRTRFAPGSAGFLVPIIGLLLACGGAASGQTAQGDGRAMDRNQQQGSGGINRPARPDFSAELRFRNAIVTGNAPNGLSFRGDLGYSADREFRGQLGSDDLFSFRRDSFYSGLSGLGIRGTDALQYQFALTTGNAVPRELAGSLSVSRDAFTSNVPATASTAAVVDQDRFGSPSPSLARVSPEELEDVTGAGMWRLRSPSAYTAERSLAESFVGSVNTNDGSTFAITASPLSGVRLFDPTTSDAAAALRDQRSQGAGVGARMAAPTAAPTTASTGATLTPAVPGVGYDGYLEQLGGAYERAGGQANDADGTVTDLVREQNRKLADFLTQLRDPGAEAENAQDPAAPPATGDRPLNDAERLQERLRNLGVEDETIDALRDSDLTIDDLVGPSTGSQRGFFALHMNEGRKLMADASYFGAEARFALALSLRENDPTAAIARVHAQLGAGLFLSASINLRATLNENPVLIGATYAPDLIPSTDRLRVLAERLTPLAREGGAEGRGAALLLAYVGHHLADRELIERGLDRIDLEVEDPLSQLLRVVWLGAGEDAGDGDANADNDGNGSDDGEQDGGG